MLARFAVLSRLKPHANSRPFAKMRVYDGENIRETDPKVRTMQEYRDTAGVDEGMDGISTRFAYKVLSATFNHSSNEVAADPVHLMYVLEQAIRREQFPPETEASYLATIKSELAARYAEFIGNEIQKAYLESYGDYGQNLFDRYLDYADAWIEDQDFKDPDTGQMMNRESLNGELTKIEKPAGIANPKDFRNEVVKFALRNRAANGGRNPVLDVLRENPRGDRKADVLPGGGFAARDQLRLEEVTAIPRRSTPTSSSAWCRAATPNARCVGWSSGTCGSSSRPERAHLDIIDRRSNPHGKNLENRQRVLARARGAIARAARNGDRPGHAARNRAGRDRHHPCRRAARAIVPHRVL